MTAATTATAGVDVDPADGLAACILAMLEVVRRRLQEQHPEVGRIEAQARAAFDQQRWCRLTEPGLPGSPAATRACAEAIGEYIDGAAAQGLAAGMDVQLARGWAPEVAWQRALAGYGLEPRAMRGYLANVMSTKAKRATAVVPAAARQRVARALLDHAQGVAADGIAVARRCGRTKIAKYDPDEPRDEAGRWTAGAGRGRPVKERERDDTLDRILADVADETPEPSRYAPQSRYAPRPSRYAPQPSRYAPQPSRYAPQPSRYAPQPSRYAPPPRPQQLRRHLVVFLGGGTKDPQGRPPTTTPGSGQLYIPMDDIAEYFHADARSADISGLDHRPDGTYVDFSRLHQMHFDIHNVDQRIEVRHSADPLRRIDPALPEVDDDVWSGLAQRARAIWQEVHDHPTDYAMDLDGHDLHTVWRQAGEPGNVPVRDIADAIADAGEALELGHEPADPSLLNALADHVAWVRPDVTGEDGEQLFDDLREHYADHDLDDPPIPGILVFPEGLADGDDAADMRGRYRVKHVEYVSGLGEYGSGIPNGFIGAQVIHLVPDPYDDRV